MKKDYILSCQCSGQAHKAKMAYEILRPECKVPEVIVGTEKILKLGCELNNVHIKSIAKIKGVFSYFISVDGDEIVEEYNLMTGKRLR